METKIKVNEEALKAWFEPEWERQVYLAEHAVNIIRQCKFYRKVADIIPNDAYSALQGKVMEANALLAHYSKARVSMPICVISQSDDLKFSEKLNELNMDEIEKAAYDEDSMKILMEGHFGSLAKPTPFTMLSYAITNHFWNFFGAFGMYPYWSNPIRDYGNMCNDFGKMKEAIYTHLVCKMQFWIERGKYVDPEFGNEISAPKQFCIEE